MDAPTATLLARQPIFNAEQNVVAYELLFRNAPQDKADIQDPDLATSQLLINALGSKEIVELTGQHKAFINCTRNLMINPLLIDPKHHVLELLEDQVIDQQLLDALKALRKKGFVIALDDFLYSEEWKPALALALADIVKVDLLLLKDDAELVTLTEQLKPFNVTLLAEKVEDLATYQRCKELGYELFQGYFFCKPELVEGRTITPSKLAVCELLGKLQEPEICFEELAEIVKHDASLSLKLIHIANSPFYSPRRPIEQINQALTMLGLDHLRRLVSALALAQMDDKPNELAVSALQRAQMAYELGKKANQDAQHLFFLGLLSMLDAFMDVPLEEALSSLNLSDQGRDALLSGSGALGVLLAVVKNYSCGQWQQIDWDALERLGINHTALADAYIISIKQANSLNAASKG